MLKTGMSGTGINDVCNPQLMDIVQSLEWLRIDEHPLKLRKTDESMNSIVNLLIPRPEFQVLSNCNLLRHLVIPFFQAAGGFHAGNLALLRQILPCAAAL